MQTAIQEMVSIVEMEFENGVEISMRVFHGMLLKALFKERQQMIDFHIEVMKQGLIEEGDAKWEEGYRPKITKEAEKYFAKAFKKAIPVNLDFKDTLCEGCGNYNMQCTCYEKSRDDHFNGLR
jgi:hypothetical protein